MEGTKKIESHRGKTFRTDHFTSEQIVYLNEKATDQEKEIGWFYRNNPEVAIGPGRLHEKLQLPWPLTSTRRAINNLTDAGILVKTDRTSEGIFGKPEYLWRWRMCTPTTTDTHPVSHQELLNRQRQRDAGQLPRWEGDLAGGR